MNVVDWLAEKAAALGFQAAGVTGVEPLAEVERQVVERVQDGYLSGMPWFDLERARRVARPATLVSGARSIVTLAASYWTPDPVVSGAGMAPRGRIARYAWGRDYHKVLRRRLQELLDGLTERRGPLSATRLCIDTSPLAERAVAQQAGLVWCGKHTNVFVPGTGSYVFLGAIVSEAELPVDGERLRQSCGSCDLCIRACPTGALIAPFVLDGNRCLSFQTIENRGPIPIDLRPALGELVFGCDICQDVCPVNRRVQPTTMAELQPRSEETVAPTLPWLLALSEQRYLEAYAGTAMIRAKRRGLRRNAAVALGNSGDRGVVPDLAVAARDPDPLLRGHAAWSLGRLGGRQARRMLERLRRSDPDPGVADEAQAALEGQEGLLAAAAPRGVPCYKD